MALEYSYPYYSRPPKQAVEMQHLWKVMDDIQKAIVDGSIAVSGVISLLSGYVQSVTDDGNGIVVVDNTDTQNPVIQYNGLSPLMLMGG